MNLLIAVLVLIVFVFGAAATMDSYATAKQAQAAIEVAKVAQVNAWGNLIVILTLVLVIVCVLALAVWLAARRGHPRRVGTGRRAQEVQTRDDAVMPQMNLELLVQLKTLEMLERMSGSGAQQTQQTPRLEELSETDEVETLGWLRRR